MPDTGLEARRGVGVQPGQFGHKTYDELGDEFALDSDDYEDDVVSPPSPPVRRDYWPSCADTSKMIRAELSVAFPGVKFSVKSSVYSGGSSIRVSWTDGPAAEVVETLTGRYGRKRYNMNSDIHESGANTVSSGADYVFTQREISDELVASLVSKAVPIVGGIDYCGAGGCSVRLNDIEEGSYIPLKNSHRHHIQDGCCAEHAAQNAASVFNADGTEANTSAELPQLNEVTRTLIEEGMSVSNALKVTPKLI